MAPKNLPQAFSPDSEEDVRLLVAAHFAELGFELDELSTEDSFTIQLGTNTIVIGAKKEQAWVSARSDMLLMRQGHPFAIVEFKAPDVTLVADHARQAISYARLLAEIAPFAIVTNANETHIYDVLAPNPDPVPLTAIGESEWFKKGCRIRGIADDLRYEAARVLIGLNAETLAALCQSQLARALEDLKGSVAENSVYIPDVYLQRQNIALAVAEWMASDSPCFALVGSSGLGKTNELCATAELWIKEHFVLFYRALRLPSKGVLEAIRRDFVWEFQRDRDPAHAIDRFDGLARTHGHPFLLIVDGLDEFPGSYEDLKSELIDLAQRLRGRAVRLLVSCKDFDWAEFVIDQAQSYNALAKSIYPARTEIHHPIAPAQPNAKLVGHWMTSFGEAEEDAAFARYAQAYGLRGRLTQALRKECRVPLMMRLVAETYRGRSQSIPTRITSRDLYRRFWTRTMSRVRNMRTDAQQFLAVLARHAIEQNQVEVPLLDIAHDMGTSSRIDTLCNELAQAGMIQVTTDEYGARKVGFRFRKVAAYAYLTVAERWSHCPVEQVAAAICHLLETPLGAETIEMYLTVLDEGRTNVLTRVAAQDFPCFSSLISELHLDSHITEHPEESDRDSLLMKRLKHYVGGYSFIARHYFGQLSDQIAPFAPGEVGGLLYGSGAFQLRIRTPACPEPLISVDPQWLGLFMRQQLPLDILADLLPGGTIRLGEWDIIDKLPEKIAWDEIVQQIGGMFGNRLLDEAGTPFLLRERAWQILLNDFPAPIDGLPRARTFVDVLGFPSVESLTSTPLADVLKQLRHIMHIIIGKAQQGISVQQCELQLKSLGHLYYALDQLATSASHLEPLPYKWDTLISYLNTSDMSETITALRMLVPEILRAYQALVEHNLLGIAEHLAFYRHRGGSLLIEVARSVNEHHRSDFLTVAYVLLPTADLPEPVFMMDAGTRSAFAHIWFIRKTLFGHSTSHGSSGARFGYAPVHLNIGGRVIDEPRAAIYFTTYPSHCVVLQQSYQLLGAEVKHLLRGSIHGWSDLEYGRLDNPQANERMQLQLLRRLSEGSL